MDIKMMRKRMKLTQVALAGKLGVTELTVRRWEKGHNQPSPMAQRLINEFLTCTEQGRGKGEVK